MMIVSFSPSTHLVRTMYVPFPYPYLAVCMHLFVFPHTHTSYLRYANACFFFGHVDEWALDDFSAHLNGTFVCSSTAHFTSPS